MNIRSQATLSPASTSQEPLQPHILSLTSQVSTMEMSPDNTLLAIGYRSGEIGIFHYPSYELKTTLTGHTHDVLCILFLDNEHLITGSSDETIKIWDVNTQTCRTLRGHTGYVVGLALSESELMSASHDKTIRYWNLETGVCRLTLQGYNESAHYALTNTMVSAIKYFPKIREAATYLTGYMLLKEYDETPSQLVTLPNGNIACSTHDATISILHPEKVHVYLRFKQVKSHVLGMVG